MASREDILHTALMGEEEGIINDFESDIIENTLKLKEIKVKDILTPRSVMFAVDKNQKIADILEDQRTFRYSRVPVYDENVDNVVGVILTKKLFKHALRDKNTTIESIMKPIDFVNENIPVSKAINMITKNKAHLLLVTDNYDQTEGIVTLEDCLETILGLEIMDESDITEDMRKLAQAKMKAKRKQKEESA
jgi:CBS domain containing-hemolysin-like protein